MWLLCSLCLSTVIGCGDPDSAVIGASADAQVAEADTGALSDTNDTDTENTDTENTDKNLFILLKGSATATADIYFF